MKITIEAANFLITYRDFEIPEIADKRKFDNFLKTIKRDVERGRILDNLDKISKTEEPPDEPVNIMRHPVLMEDEGRTFLIKGPIKRSEAKKWIADQKDEYFKPSDYFMQKLEEDR